MKTRGSSKLSKTERQKLILALCRALSVLKNPQEVAEALTDLLTPKEVETIAKRLEIAERLVKGEDYITIRNELKVGNSTISRVNTWLNLSGQGFKIMLGRRKKSPEQPSLEEKYDPYSWHNIKRRYSMYYWPQLLLENLINQADQKEKKKILEMMDELQIKKQHFRNQRNKKLYEMMEEKLKQKS
jgi:TrpR-related protein YerC/YecD